MSTIPSGFPTAENTGVPAGTTLSTYNGTLVVTQDNAVISGLRITGNVVINAKNVTMQNCVIDTTTPYHAILIPDGYTGFTLKNSEINGNGQTVNAISGSGTFLNNDIKGVENGINVYGASVIENNYIHDMAGGSAAHFDGIENNGASNIQIIHNTIINDYDQTSAVMLNNEFGGLRNITVDGNYLVGGGYTIYLDGRKGGGAVDDASIRITNNQIVAGYWGAFAFYDDAPVETGNSVNGIFRVTSGSDVLTGTAGNDTLNGGGGADVMSGGLGNDTYFVDNPRDVVTELVGGGIDTVRSKINFTLPANVENLALTGSANTSGKGNSLANLLVGNSGSNVLDGEGGADTLKGGTGNDTLKGGKGQDRLAGGAGNDVLIGGSNADFLVGGTGRDTFAYQDVLESTSVTYDTIAGFDTANDSIDLPVSVSRIDPAIASGRLSDSKFNADLTAAANGATLLAHHAAIFTPDKGAHAGETFLIVDANGVAGYQAREDYVIKLENPVAIGALSTNRFV